VVAEGHGLSDLEVREARHDEAGMALRLLEQRALKRREKREDLVDLGAQPEPQVGRDLVVARARGVQPFAGFADERGQPALDVEMHVFGVERPAEAPLFDLAAHPRKAALDRGQLAPREQARGGEHARVGERAFDVILGEPLVKSDRCRKALDLLFHRLAESTRPAGFFFWHRIRLKSPT
jgi:hypothetical protein